jgi:hypothetical protein
MRAVRCLGDRHENQRRLFWRRARRRARFEQRLRHGQPHLRSGLGSDSNPCSLGAPCRSFAQAITQTTSGGEIAVLDTAGYGSVTIDRSVTITNPGGVEAGVTATSGETAITIAAGSNGIVTLRGLTIEGGGVGYRGIDATSFSKLNIIDCVVKDFMDGGIFVQPSAGTTNVVIANTFALRADPESC